MSQRRLAGLAALTLAALAATPVVIAGSRPQRTVGVANGQVVIAAQHFHFFASGSFWNKPLLEESPIDPQSTPIVERLEATVEAEQAEERGPSIKTDRWSVPIYTVGPEEPTVRVEHINDGTGATLQAAWEAVPLPADAHPAAGTDHHLVVWQPSTDRLWEFWHLRREDDRWLAGWGGAMEDVLGSSGVYGPTSWPGAKVAWGGSASSLSLAGGVITFQDLAARGINHALAIGIPEVRAGVISPPAERTDGDSTDPLALPEGARLRLDPHLNLTTLHLPPMTLMIARAAQTYGLVVRSRADIVDFYAQDPTRLGTNPYTAEGGYFGGVLPRDLLASFPWHHLRLLKMEPQPYEPSR